MDRGAAADDHSDSSRLATPTVLAGCGAAPPPPRPRGGRRRPERPADAGPTRRRCRAGTLVMVIRHGEKPEDDAGPGLDANGVEDDSSLTQVGWDRAHRLVDLFDPAQGALRPGLARPKAIYAAGANDNGEGQRTRETVKPLADRLGIPVNTSFGKGDEEELVEHVLVPAGADVDLVAAQRAPRPSPSAFPR